MPSVSNREGSGRPHELTLFHRPFRTQRYKQLLFFATKLEPLPDEEKTQENKVKGCVSQVWVVPQMDAEGRIHWKADSDSQLTKVSAGHEYNPHTS